ncbi:MAG: hypothetical protein QOI62_1786 [Solirubrobacteraceae bacterium]|jgi:hypothetical protein|nr:hypothetical protein [Solirubrobacteraceae bacterium]
MNARAISSAVVVVLVAAILPPLAGAATGPILLPSPVALHHSPSADLAFPVPVGWVIGRGLAAGTPSAGEYQLRHRLSLTATCTLQLQVTGFALRAKDRPSFGDGVLRASHPPNAGLARFRVVMHGTSAQGAWYLGTASQPRGGLAQRAAAVLRSPRPVAPGARRTVLVRLTATAVASPSTTQLASSCRRFAAGRLGAALRVAARHVAVVAIP